MNARHDARRADLLERLRERLARPDAPHPSFRELAEACGVGQTTLRHYFGGRDGAIRAVLGAWLARGAPVFAFMAQPSGPFPTSVRDLLAYAATGHRMPELRQLHRVGLAEGLRSSAIGPDVVAMLLEPMLRAAEDRLAAHMARGEMRRADPRAAALILMAPVLTAFLHQADLGGRDLRPLDVDALLDEQAAMFVSAYAARATAE